MPDPFDFDEVRRALEEVPAPDLWDEATQRASLSASAVVALDDEGGRRGRRPLRWLAAAAVAVLTVGTIGMLTLDDDAAVDTAPSGDGGPAGPCVIKLPVPLSDGPSPRLTRPDAAGHMTMHGTWTDDEAFEVTAPAATEINSGGQAEPVTLDRGTALLYYDDSDGSAQVQFAPRGASGCDTFSVTVASLGLPGRLGGRSVEADAAIEIANAVEVSARAVDDGPTTSVFGAEGCFFAVSGDPVALTAGPADPPLFDPSSQSDGQTIAHGTLGASQVVEIHVPGLTVLDLVGERVEDVELERGTAQVWFGEDFVQVRWFTGSQEDCESFTVTVTGSTEDGNRHAAVDLAERIRLPDEIRADEPPGSAVATIEGEWQLERSEVGGEPTEGTGLVFSFVGGSATWTDGCNTFQGVYEPAEPLRLTEVTKSTDITSGAIGCPSNPTADIVQSVMGADAIEISGTAAAGTSFLQLSADDAVLTLRPLVPDDGEVRLADTEWTVAALYRGDDEVLPRPTSFTFSFDGDSVRWDDGCSHWKGRYSIVGDTVIVTNAVATIVARCPDVGASNEAWELINAVMRSGRIHLDEMGGQVELSDTERNHIALERR